MKVALIGLRLSVGNRLMVDTLGTALRRLGVEVIVVGERAYQPPEGIAKVGVSDGSSYAHMFRDFFRYPLYQETIAALGAARPDICYFVSVHPANVLIAWSIRRRVRSPDGERPVIAMHLHDPLPHPGVASMIIYATQHLQVRAADRVVVYGAQLAGQVRRHYGVAAGHVVIIRHPAYRLPRDAPPANAPGYRWFSFLGRIEAYKGLDVFLDAALRLHAQDPASRFFVGGAGDLAPYRRALEALGESVVVEHRELSNEETDDVMRTSWAVVLPYHSATQSGVVPVAYWNACPVIVTRVGALGEVVRDGQTGFIVERGDAAAVAECMHRLQGDPALRWRLGSGAFAFYDRWLRWERIVDDLLRALGTQERGLSYTNPVPSGERRAGT